MIALTTYPTVKPSMEGNMLSLELRGNDKLEFIHFYLVHSLAHLEYLIQNNSLDPNVRKLTLEISYSLPKGDELDSLSCISTIY